ncbi:MAG: hypothetical protein ACFE9R_15905 [Candidatus Hermodarchaeota archaeon]
MRKIHKTILLVGVNICIVLIIIVSLVVYFNYSNKVIHTTGTITYLDFEGGFFGIIGDDDENYDPINLPEEFESEGLRVEFTAIKREDLGSFHMWGILIELIDIQEL